MKPLLLDLYCGAGGAAMGYARAGFEVIGVDVAPQPDYPFEFRQGDALTVARELLPHRIAAIHASPPCQASCALIKGNQRATAGNHVDLIPETRALLELSGLPYVIENVQGAAVRRDLTLCGEMFGLDVIRHRYFECSFPVVQPVHVKHRGRVAGMRHGVWYEGPYFAVYGDGGGKGSVAQWQSAMGIDWTAKRKSIAEAIPPAYAEYVGGQLLKALAP
jgi:hypothetical protein